MKIRLLTFHGCPNVTETRHRLSEAMKAEGLDPQWEEIEVPDAETAGRERFLGSPSIQIDGQDVEVARRDEKPSWSCRTYRDAQGNISDAPPVEMIRSAIRQSVDNRSSHRGFSGIWHAFASLPGVGAALLPVAVCPACLPVYLGFLSAVGLGFLLQTKYLLPLMAGLLAMALVALAYEAPKRRGYGPLVMGMAASASILIGRFLLNSDVTVYVGVTFLLAASVWNLWPQKAAGATVCSTCVPTSQTDQSEHTKDQEVIS